MKPLRKKTGFTLVEVLIMISILGILAALIYPEFNNTTIKSKNQALITNLTMVRKQIELYALHHGGNYPGTIGNTSWDQALTFATDEDGYKYISGVTPEGAAKYGPYLPEMPVNPFNGLSTVRHNGEEAGANTHGWRTVPLEGTFHADDDQFTEDGVAHSEL